MRSRSSERARTGIGTLVVFLGMVLVASVAAGVLINTAGLLGGAVGDESTDNAAAGLMVVGASGEHVRSGSVGSVNLTVMAGPEAETIDLRDATVTWVGPDGAYNVRNVRAGGTDDAPTFQVTALSDPDGSAPAVNGPNDRVVLTFDLGRTDDVGAVDEFGSRLRGGDMVKVRITTGDGATTTTRLAVPPAIAGRNAVVL